MRFPLRMPVFMNDKITTDEKVYASCLDRAKKKSHWYNGRICGTFEHIQRKYIELENEAQKIYNSLRNKRKIRFLRGQWMQITDRREQYKRRLADCMRYKAP